MDIYIESARIRIIESASEIDLHRDQVYLQSNAEKLWQTYQSLRDGSILGADSIAFVVSDVHAVLEEFLAHFILAEAAGGIVTKDGQLLFIKRLDKWDLAKGHIEKGESPQQAAIREVEEETGVKASIDHALQETWHTYQRHGSEWMKKTHWYKMSCTNDLNIRPQTEEGIDEVKWVSVNDLEKQVIPFTYDSLLPVISKYVRSVGG